MKRKAIRVVLALMLALSICLVTAVPTTAGDGNGGRAAGIANGAGEWTWAGGDYAYPWNMAWHGRFVFHYQEAHHEQPAKGFGYSTWICDDEPLEMWILIRVEDVSIVRDNEAWALCEIVACSENSLVGTLNVVGWLDGGTPGRNGDMIFSALAPYDLFPAGTTVEEIYDWGKAGALPWLSPVTKGNVAVKAK